MNSKNFEMAEILGITLGDGSLYHNEKHNIWQFVITGHIQNDREYLEKFVLPLLEKHFENRFRIVNDNRAGAIRIKCQERLLLQKIVKLGIPIGNKLKNDVKIPDWIFSNKDFLRSCVRGLIDTDGSVCPITGRNYSYIWFKSKIPALQKSFSRAMNILGFKISNWTLGGNYTPQVYIGAKMMIAKYQKEISFNNPYHKSRFKAPIV